MLPPQIQMTAMNLFMDRIRPKLQLRVPSTEQTPIKVLLELHCVRQVNNWLQIQAGISIPSMAGVLWCSLWWTDHIQGFPAQGILTSIMSKDPVQHPARTLWPSSCVGWVSPSLCTPHHSPLPTDTLGKVFDNILREDLHKAFPWHFPETSPWPVKILPFSSLKLKITKRYCHGRRKSWALSPVLPHGCRCLLCDTGFFQHGLPAPSSHPHGWKVSLPSWWPWKGSWAGSTQGTTAQQSTILGLEKQMPIRELALLSSNPCSILFLLFICGHRQNML